MAFLNPSRKPLSQGNALYPRGCCPLVQKYSHRSTGGEPWGSPVWCISFRTFVKVLTIARNWKDTLSVTTLLLRVTSDKSLALYNLFFPPHLQKEEQKNSVYVPSTHLLTWRSGIELQRRDIFCDLNSSARNLLEQKIQDSKVLVLFNLAYSKCLEQCLEQSRCSVNTYLMSIYVSLLTELRLGQAGTARTHLRVEDTCKKAAPGNRVMNTLKTD